MKIALLFGLFPKDDYNNIIKNSKGVIQYAADALQKSIVEGFSCFTHNINIINLPYIGSFPKRYLNFWSPKGDFKYVNDDGMCIYGTNVRFCNLCGYKLFSRFNNAYKELMNWCEKNKEGKKVVVIYAIHTPFIKACVRLKKTYKVKIVLIVPDLPEYMGGQNSFIRNNLRKLNHKILTNLYPSIDGFVLLSKYMAELLPIQNKPWTVVEGIFNNASDNVSIDVNREDDKIKTIFYSGTLAKRYGILNLVEAISSMDDENVRLMICGDGDSVGIIKEYVKKDNRIIYKGQLIRTEVLKLQRSATLLVNPRTPEGEFTKYSFPSKTMEYLASGVPTLLYKLPGIPEEYYQYCYTIDELGISVLACKISEILKLDDVVLKRKGLEAQKFIYENKNPKEQTKKIINLINHIN